MAKKDKKKKDKKDSGTGDPVEAVRSAVERTLKATGESTAGAQKHARDLVDEVAQAANRFREAMGDLKVLDDLKKEVAGLRQRVAALEGKVTSTAAPRRTATKSTAAKSTAAKKPAASRSRSTAAKKAGEHALAEHRGEEDDEHALAEHRGEEDDEHALAEHGGEEAGRHAFDRLLLVVLNHGRRVLIAEGVPDHHGLDLLGDERGPGDGSEAARGGRPAAVRVP